MLCIAIFETGKQKNTWTCRKQSKPNL